MSKKENKKTDKGEGNTPVRNDGGGWKKGKFP